MIEYHENFSLEPLFYINDDGLVCQEEFIDIIEYEGYYQLSTLGRAKSVDRTVIYKDRRVYFVKGRILKGSFVKRGYLKISLSIGNNIKNFEIQNLMGRNFLGNDPSITGLICDHKNNIHHDNRLSNLQIINNRGNTTKDKVNKSGVHGVYFRCNRFYVAMRVKDNKKTHFGNFETLELAKERYDLIVSLLENNESVEHLLSKMIPASTGFKGTCVKGNRFGAQATIFGKTRNLGVYDTLQEAHEAYLFAIENKHLYKEKPSD